MDVQPIPPTSPPVWIAEPAALRRLVEVLLAQPIVAVDTESNSLHAFRERVCLLQFSTPEEDYLVDPLALEDLSPLAAVFAAPQVEKVFHGADYDILTLRRDFGFTFANLFDTMLAARLLGLPQVGLSALLSRYFGVQLDKRFQQANWGQRPLPQALLDYARLDTRYLIPLRERLKAELESRGRWDLAVEDFARLERLHPRVQERPPWAVRGAHRLTPRQRAVLAQLVAYRDAVAERLDRPRFKVLPDRVLVAVAEACPRTLAALAQVPGMSPGWVRRHGQALLKAVARGLQAPPLPMEPPPRPDEAYLARYEALRRWRSRRGKALGIPSDGVLPRDLLAAIAARNPQDLQALAQVMAHAPHRFARFGEEILHVLREVTPAPEP